MDRLLTLSEERIAAELRRIVEIDVLESTLRRKQLGAATSAAVTYVAGIGLIGMSWHVTDRDQAEILFSLGFLVAIGGPTTIGYWWWSREQW